MPPLTDPIRLKAYRNALANHRFGGYVVWKDVAADWVWENLTGLQPSEIAYLMHRHVEAGGRIDEVVETRPEWEDYEFHYDLRLVIKQRRIYIETILIFKDPDDPDDPWIEVVSIHEQ